MDGMSAISAIDQKMAEMKIKNLELLKRHQEIEEDRQLAQQSGATIITSTVESNKAMTMRSTTKNRGRNPNYQENQYERIPRPPMRRKIENDRNDNQLQQAQRVDYNRLKYDRAQEAINQQYHNNIVSHDLEEYAYPFHYQSENHHDADEPAYAKKLVIVNNQATRVGSGRFNQQQQQQQRTQEQGQRRREERMRRSGTNNNGHPGGPSEFHFDVPQIPIWHNSSMQPPMHLHLLSNNLNGSHTGLDPLMNNPADQLDQSNYLHNFVFPTQTSPSTAFNSNGTVYFAPAPMSNVPPTAQSVQGHFHQYHPTRTFENSNRQQFHFQTPSSTTQNITPSSSMSHIQQQQQQQSEDLPPRFRRLVKTDQQRPMSGDFDRFHQTPRYNPENRFQSRPQSFYDFSSHHLSNSNSFRSSNNNNTNNPNSNRYQRNTNPNTLPLSAYMNTDTHENEHFNSNNSWGTNYQRRRNNQQQRSYQDKHQFPLSSYDPRQYGFHNNYQRRNEFNTRTNSNRRNPNQIDQGNDIDLIEEWWEDDNTELIGTNQSTTNNDSKAAIDDSGNSSLSTSIHLKESTLDDEEHNTSTNDVISPPSDLSVADSNIIESLDQLQQQLKLEEAVEKELANESDLLDDELFLLNKQSTTYDTAHFLQWAKKKFREELAERLTAQEIEQHDAVVTDDDDDDEDLVLHADLNLEKYQIDPIPDEDLDELKMNLDEKLKIEEDSIVVE